MVIRRKLRFMRHVRKGPLGRARHKWKNNIKMGLKEQNVGV
jgi:hypothetical protein